MLSRSAAQAPGAYKGEYGKRSPCSWSEVGLLKDCVATLVARLLIRMMPSLAGFQANLFKVFGNPVRVRVSAQLIRSALEGPLRHAVGVEIAAGHVPGRISSPSWRRWPVRQPGTKLSTPVV